MAMDTAAKRSSSLDHEEPWQFCAPIPDGTIGQGDRQHSVWSYSGILAATIAVAAADFTMTLNIARSHALELNIDRAMEITLEK